LINTVLLNPCFDVVYSLQNLQPGTTQLDTRAQFFPAGKAVSVATAVRALGEPVTVYAIMPKSGISIYERYLQQLDIGFVCQPIEGDVRVNTTITEEQTGRVTHLNSRSAPVRPSALDGFLRMIDRAASPSDTWALSGSLPPSAPEEFYRRVLSRLQGFRLLDTRAEALRHGLMAKPEAIKPNLEEMSDYFQESLRGVHHVALRGKRFLDMGIESIFITLAEEGMIAISRGDCLLCTGPKIDAVDTVGCGDAFVAGVLVSQKKSYSFYETCRLAMACGISNALHRGPGQIEREQVFRIMEEIKIESV